MFMVMSSTTAAFWGQRKKGVDGFDFLLVRILELLRHGHTREKSADVGFHVGVLKRALVQFWLRPKVGEVLTGYL